MKVDFVVGNRIEIPDPEKKCKFRWTAFIRLDDPVGLGLNVNNIISRMTVGVHETYKFPHVREAKYADGEF